MDSDTLCGPLINQQAVQNYLDGIEQIQTDSSSKVCLQNSKNIFFDIYVQILIGGKALPELGPHFVSPTIVSTHPNAPFVKNELFAPILYVVKFSTETEAIKMNNSLSSHGLSSSIFTSNPQTLFNWIGPDGSDCGLVNVNIGLCY